MRQTMRQTAMTRGRTGSITLGNATDPAVTVPAAPMPAMLQPISKAFVSLEEMLAALRAWESRVRAALQKTDAESMRTGLVDAWNSQDTFGEVVVPDQVANYKLGVQDVADYQVQMVTTGQLTREAAFQQQLDGLMRMLEPSLVDIRVQAAQKSPGGAIEWKVSGIPPEWKPKTSMVMEEEGPGWLWIVLGGVAALALILFFVLRNRKKGRR